VTEWGKFPVVSSVLEARPLEPGASSFYLMPAVVVVGDAVFIADQPDGGLRPATAEEVERVFGRSVDTPHVVEAGS
jgi:hypothetical protein